MSWRNNLDPDVELAVVQLPGRGIRFSERPYQTMEEMVSALFLAMEKLDSKPFIFYGHSMGARVAYELSLMLHRSASPLPIHFIASGSVAPCIKMKNGIHGLPDSEFILRIAKMNGSNPDVLANHQLMQVMLPTLRADFRIIETYCNTIKSVIPTGISVLVGDKEYVERSDMEAWFDLFETSTGIHSISGDHFFVDKNKADVLKVVSDIIGFCRVGDAADGGATATVTGHLTVRPA